MRKSSPVVFLFAIALVILSAQCRSDKAPEAEQQKDLTSGLYPQYMDTTVAPGDNFQLYVNGNWIQDTEIPSDKSSYGVMSILSDNIQANIREIIEGAAEIKSTAGTDEQKIGDLYTSYLDTVRRNETGIAPLMNEFEKIDALTSKKDLPAYFSYANRAGYTAPFAFFVMPDLKEPNTNALYCWQNGLGLPDREFYLSKDGKFPQIRTAYQAHIAKMLELAGLKDADKKAAAIMALETKMAAQHMKKEETRNIEGLYNPFPAGSLSTDLMPDFDWSVFLAEAGVPQVETLIVTMPEYMKALNGILKSTDMDTWKTYLKWSVVNATASRLSMALDQEHFNFYGKVLSGTEQPLPMWHRAVDVVNDNLGEVVGKVYVKKHFTPEAKARMEELVDNLLKAYEASIKELDWMSDTTKQKALEKLSKFRPKIGYPDTWKDYSDVSIRRDDLFGNIRSCTEAEYKKEIEKVGKPVDKTEWTMTPQTVNAYYNPTGNEIVFPAAILQPPYFDMDADDAVNYGAIGGVIGHEIGHGFDDQGSTFDGDGALSNWWTDSDRERFKQRTAMLVDQYNSFKVFDDLNVNGEFTLGENIGDLGGLSIALKAYKMSLNGQDAPVMDGFTGVQRVFLGWAQAWRSKAREENLRMMVSTNPHSPADFRVNGVVRNIPDFYEAFGVTPQNTLYLAPENRVKIW
ncbi:MAG: M13 family metallopeptidase [Lewinella sp.]|nr:M13 family metallopeptidase [Lewinella sp.]